MPTAKSESSKSLLQDQLLVFAGMAGACLLFSRYGRVDSQFHFSDLLLTTRPHGLRSRCDGCYCLRFVCSSASGQSRTAGSFLPMRLMEAERRVAEASKSIFAITRTRLSRLPLRPSHGWVSHLRCRA